MPPKKEFPKTIKVDGQDFVVLAFTPPTLVPDVAISPYTEILALYEQEDYVPAPRYADYPDYVSIDENGVIGEEEQKYAYRPPWDDDDAQPQKFYALREARIVGQTQVIVVCSRYFGNTKSRTLPKYVIIDGTLSESPAQAEVGVAGYPAIQAFAWLGEANIAEKKHRLVRTQVCKAPRTADPTAVDPQYLTRKQAAEYLQVSTRTLDRWCHDGLVHAVACKGRTIRFTKAQLDAEAHQLKR